MMKPFSLCISFMGGFVTGGVLSTHYFASKGELHPLELMYKKQSQKFIDDFKKHSGHP